MEVFCAVSYNRETNTPGEALDCLNCGSKLAQLRPYVNKRTGLEDPRVVWTESRWIHLSTCLLKGFLVVEKESGRLLTFDDLPALAEITQANQPEKLRELFF